MPSSNQHDAYYTKNKRAGKVVPSYLVFIYDSYQRTSQKT
jgi:hypothetical protein